MNSVVDFVLDVSLLYAQVSNINSIAKTRKGK